MTADARHDRAADLTADQVIEAIGLDLPAGLRDSWREHWDRSGATYDPDGSPPFDPGELTRACEAIGLRAPLRRALHEALADIVSHPAMRRLAWHLHWRLFHDTDEARINDFRHAPALPDHHGPAGAMFYGLVLLSGFDHVEQFCRERHIAASVIRDTLMDFERWAQQVHEGGGRWVIVSHSWLCWHFIGRIFALGRPQFDMSDDFLPGYRFWRREPTGQLVAFAGAGMRFRSDGQCDGANGIFDSGNSWIAEYDVTEDHVTGNPIHPRGIAHRETVGLSRHDWSEALIPRTGWLSVHIPESGPMSPDACADSYRIATEFFPQRFPEFQWEGMCCWSWLMDYQLEDHLPGDSNIVRFLRRYYLLPMPDTNGDQIVERVLGPDTTIDRIDDAPQATSLQRIVVEHIRRGGQWRTSVGVICRNDVTQGMWDYRAHLPIRTADGTVWPAE